MVMLLFLLMVIGGRPPSGSARSHRPHGHARGSGTDIEVEGADAFQEEAFQGVAFQ